MELYPRHVPLRDAVDTLRAGEGSRAAGGTDEAAMLQALAVVRRFAESESRLVVFSGVVPILVALTCGNGGTPASGSEAVQEAALRALGALARPRDLHDTCDVVIGALVPAAVPALLRCGDRGAKLGILLVLRACLRFPHLRNAMLTADVGIALADYIKRSSTVLGGRVYTVLGKYAKDAQQALTLLIHTTDLPPTPLQALTALPKVLEWMRQPSGVLGLNFVLALIRGGTEAHVQAALDAGVAAAVKTALCSDWKQDVSDACEVLSVLASGSAAQLAALLDAGLVSALCNCVKSLDATPSTALRTMRDFANLGKGTQENRNARVALVCGRLIPELLATVGGAGRDSPLARGALLWLSEVARTLPGAVEFLRLRGAIPAVATLLTSQQRLSADTVHAALALLKLLCENPPRPTKTIALAALPSLAPLCRCSRKGVPTRALSCALSLLGWCGTGAGLAPARPDSLEEGVQAAMDAGFVGIIMNAMRCKGREHSENAYRAAAYMALGNARQLRQLLEAGMLPALLLAAGQDSGSSTYRTHALAAARLVAGASVAAPDPEVRDGQSTLLLRHALPQLLEALAAREWSSGVAGTRQTTESYQRFVGALKVLRELAEAGEGVREAVFSPDVIAALAGFVGDINRVVFLPVDAASILERLCTGPPPPSVAMADAILPRLLPLCQGDNNLPSKQARSCLHALAAVIPTAVSEGLRQHGLPPLPAPPAPTRPSSPRPQ